jgi:hypothetical protein
MTGVDLEMAPSGPPPIATRQDDQGVIVTQIERPAPEVIAPAVASTRGSSSTTSASTAG